MDKENTNKPVSGTWNKLTTENVEQKPKVTFDVNITQRVVFLKNDPREIPEKEGTGVFYVFDVQQDKVDKQINTSAWTLLHALKKLEPLAGKVVDITKRLVKGRQFFEVAEIK